jgi:6-phosphogluconate dehydrogenase
MRIGMIGAGRMGGDMVRRLLRRGHECVVHDRDEKAVFALAGEGAVPAASAAELAAHLSPPRVVWLMVPAAVVDNVVGEVSPLLSPGDILVDGGNSH